MQVIKSKGSSWINIVFFLYLFSAILEKFKWNIFGWGCDLFTLNTVLIFFVLSVYCLCTDKLIIITTTEKKFLKYFVFLLCYMFLQFFFLEHSSVILVQYLKGIIALILQIIAIYNFILIINIKGNSFNFRYVSRCLYIITVINACYCLIQNFYPNVDEILVRIFHSDVSRWGVDSYGPFGRVTGFLLESNFNAAFLLIGLINEISLIRQNLNNKNKKIRILILFTCLTFFEFIWTFSRTAYLGFAVALIYYFIKASRKIKKRIILCVIVLLVFFIFIFVTVPSFEEVIRVRFSFLFGDTSISQDSHFHILVEAIQIYTKDLRTIIFGVGTNCLSDYYGRFFGYTLMKAHNYYMQILCEVGLIGFILLVYYLVALWKSARANTHKDIAYRVMFVATIFTNFTYDPFCRNYNLILILFATTLTMNVIERQSTDSSVKLVTKCSC